MKTIEFIKQLLCVFLLSIGVFSQDVPANIRPYIAASVKASNSPDADDKRGGFHEEGGMWVKLKSGAIVAIPARPGPANPTFTGNVHITVNDAANPDLVNPEDIVAVLGEYHVHPRGSLTKGDGVLYWMQPPSQVDISNCVSPTCLVVGAMIEVVYFYNQTGVIKKVDLKDFLRGKQ